VRRRRERTALAVMVKRPEPGHVKTRLCPPLTHEEAAGLYRAFLADLFGAINGAALEADILVAAAPPAAAPDFAGLVPGGVPFFSQSRGGLGERISNVFKDLAVMGYERAIVIGSDSPDLPVPYIEEAVTALSSAGVGLVLGPADDGGYYLMGASTSLPWSLFEGIGWSGPGVLDETLERARGAGLNVRFLGPWHDIDRAADLACLLKGKGAPRSRAFVEGLGPRPGLPSLDGGAGAGSGA